MIKKEGQSYRLQSCLLKQELEHEEIYEDTWEDKENEWLLYLKNDGFSSAFSYARYSKGMEELPGCGLNNSLTLPSLANNYFKSLKEENDEPIYTYNDEFMRYFVRQKTKSSRCGALNQHYKSSISDEVFKNISKELNVSGNVCEIREKYFEYTNKHRKTKENEYDS